MKIWVHYRAVAITCVHFSTENVKLRVSKKSGPIGLSIFFACFHIVLLAFATNSQEDGVNAKLLTIHISSKSANIMHCAGYSRFLCSIECWHIFFSNYGSIA